MPFSRSRSIESMTRSATSWLARKAPDCQSIWSTSVVLPWSTWATIATLRRSSRTAIGILRVSGGRPAYGLAGRSGMLPAMTTAWDDAVAAVEGGATVTEARRRPRRPDDRRRAPLVPRRRHPVLGRAGRPRARAATTGGRSWPPGSSGSASPASRSATGPAASSIGNATAFPVTMARGATWDLDLEERIGDAIGRELRAVGADLYGGVCVNALRHPAWGRAQETYGEDPHHVGELGAALTRGVQRHVMATREALRLQLDGERPLQGRRHGRRARRSTRCTSRTSSASSTRAWPA